jgi:NAD(P)-dependent dehydrogenase (short-subunit alcohol dehydrogenase family)
MILNDLFNIDGRIALVTGGTRGLGFTAALTLAQAGAAVAICGRSQDEALESAKMITEKTGKRCIGIQADVADEKSVDHLFDVAKKELGSIDILHCSAGINIRKPFSELEIADWDSVMSINIRGAFLCARKVLPAMRERKWGRVVFYASMLSYVSLAGRAAYSSSKAALLGLTRTLALESAPDGVCVNAVCPGPFITPMNQTLNQDESAQREFLRKLPIGRWGNPDELRGLLLYLSSSACSFMTGSGVVIDGGWTAQ